MAQAFPLNFVARSPDVFTATAEVEIEHLRGYKTITVDIRIDGRDRDRYRVDQHTLGPWEAIDGGAPLTSFKKAVAFTTRWVKAANAQGTLSPRMPGAGSRWKEKDDQTAKNPRAKKVRAKKASKKVAAKKQHPMGSVPSYDEEIDYLLKNKPGGWEDRVSRLMQARNRNAEIYNLPQRAFPRAMRVPMGAPEFYAYRSVEDVRPASFAGAKKASKVAIKYKGSEHHQSKQKGTQVNMGPLIKRSSEKPANTHRVVLGKLVKCKV